MLDATTILVVEDDPILKNLLGHTFSGKYHVFFAGNGKEALALLKESTPSLILLDLMMPDMDGFTFMEHIRAHPEISMHNIPIIIVSNLGQQKDIDHAKSLGAKDYLVKAEVSVEEIAAKIREVLSAVEAQGGESEELPQKQVQEPTPTQGYKEPSDNVDQPVPDVQKTTETPEATGF